MSITDVQCWVRFSYIMHTLPSGPLPEGTINSTRVSGPNTHWLVLGCYSVDSKQASVMVVGVEGHVAVAQVVGRHPLCQLAGHVVTGSHILVPGSQHCLPAAAPCQSNHKLCLVANPQYNSVVCGSGPSPCLLNDFATSGSWSCHSTL